MKGVIVSCLAELVNGKFGSQTWGDVLEGAGFDREKIFLATSDVDDA